MALLVLLAADALDGLLGLRLVARLYQPKRGLGEVEAGRQEQTAREAAYLGKSDTN